MLHKIVETKREEVQELHQTTTLPALFEQAAAMDAPRGFQRSLEQSSRPVSVIAEVKKASPSKGMIRADFHPEEIALAYQQAEVEAISVLTDKQYFQGDLGYLRQIRAAVSLPLLRKDFLIDEWQIVEARAYGADCILLIAAILEGEQIHHFSQAANQLGMDVLIEVHDAEEAEKVFRYTSPRMLGINNRNLRTFQVDLATTQELISQLPKDVTVVSESGIASRDDLAFVEQAGARAVLVGEHFMRQPDIAAAVRDLVGERVAGR
ncbi:MAG TPA: indole-3-glycerol phosphate synthase TrpC [Candidatus Bathyarchaeia archaeon]|nr:indole-3-glycerol phosphate synthase TrpC [Candidatus Bathyarchaeia archaeon]